MSSILALAPSIDDLVNNLTHNLSTSWLQPYTALMGVDIFVSILFGIIGAGIYIGSKNFQATIAYTFLIFLFLAPISIVAPGFNIFITVFGFIAALMTTSLLYYAFVTKRR